MPQDFKWKYKVNFQKKNGVPEIRHAVRLAYIYKFLYFSCSRRKSSSAMRQ